MASDPEKTPVAVTEQTVTPAPATEKAPTVSAPTKPNGNNKRPYKNNKHQQNSQHPNKQFKPQPENVIVKFLLPDVVTGALLGNRAMGLKNFRQQSWGVKAKLSGAKEIYPGLYAERMVLLEGPPPAVHNACVILQNHILNDQYIMNDKGFQTPLGPRPEQMNLITTDGGASKIIGAGGTIVKDISGQFSVDIKITPVKDVLVPGERVVSICGFPPNIFGALEPILNQIQSQNNVLNKDFEYYGQYIRPEDRAIPKKDQDNQEAEQKESDKAEEGSSKKPSDTPPGIVPYFKTKGYVDNQAAKKSNRGGGRGRGGKRGRGGPILSNGPPMNQGPPMNHGPPMNQGPPGPPQGGWVWQGPPPQPQQGQWIWQGNQQQGPPQNFQGPRPQQFQGNNGPNNFQGPPNNFQGPPNNFQQNLGPRPGPPGNFQQGPPQNQFMNHSSSAVRGGGRGGMMGRGRGRGGRGRGNRGKK